MYFVMYVELFNHILLLNIVNSIYYKNVCVFFKIGIDSNKLNIILLVLYNAIP